MLSRWFCLFTALCACIIAIGAIHDAQVLIIGGGPAAIYAAVTLLGEHGFDDFLMLAEKDELNGFLEPVDFGGITVIPGGLFGHTTNRFLFDDIFNIPLANTSYESYTVYNDDGEDVTAETMMRKDEYVAAYEEGLETVIDDLECCLKPTCCIRDICSKRPDLSKMATVARGNWYPSSDVDKLIQWFKADFKEGVSAREISTVHVEKKAMYLPGEYFIVGDASVVLAADIPLIPTENIAFNQVIFAL